MVGDNPDDLKALAALTGFKLEIAGFVAVLPQLDERGVDEAFPPFDSCYQKTNYDWSELKRFSARDAVAELDGDDLKSFLLEALSVPTPPDDGLLFRLPYQTYHAEWDAGQLSSFVDRGLAVQAYRLSNSVWTWILPAVFLLGLLTFIPLMIFVSVWLGLGVFASALLARKMLTEKAVDWVRQDALASRERYRWYSSCRIVWAKRI